MLDDERGFDADEKGKSMMTGGETSILISGFYLFTCSGRITFFPRGYRFCVDNCTIVAELFDLECVFRHMLQKKIGVGICFDFFWQICIGPGGTSGRRGDVSRAHISVSRDRRICCMEVQIL